MRWLGEKLESQGLMFSNLSFANWTLKKMRLVLPQLPQPRLRYRVRLARSGCLVCAFCLVCCGMECSHVLCGYSFAGLDSGPFPFFTSLARMCLCACIHKYTHCTLTPFVAKVSVQQATSQRAYISMSSYSLVEEPRAMSDQWEYRFSHELHLAIQLLWYGFILTKLWKTATLELLFLK